MIKRKRKTPEPEFLVDEDIGPIISLYHWNYAHRKDTSYIYRSITASNQCTYSTQSLLHRVIMEMHLCRTLSPSEIIDHINGNGLDNRLCNLRITSHSINAVKGKHRRNNTSGYRGVSLTSYGNWACEVWHGGIRVYRRAFKTKEEAALRYNKIAKMYYGSEFVPNKVDLSQCDLVNLDTSQTKVPEDSSDK